MISRTGGRGVAELKPLDEWWHAKALKFVIRYTDEHNEPPTWTELWRFMRWPRHRCGPYMRMEKLRKRGLEWDDGVARSLRVSQAGLAALRAYTEERRNRSTERGEA
jgi:hypothetical protein